MKPNSNQAFIIGYLYGCSFCTDEKVEIWCRSSDRMTKLSSLLEDNGIEFKVIKEHFRDIIKIDSYKNMSGFLSVFDIDSCFLDSSNKKRCPEWFRNCDLGDIDICSSFLLGLFESSGTLNLSEGSEPEVKMIISSPSKDLISQLYHFVRLFKEEKTTDIETEDFFVSETNYIGREIYTRIYITPLLFKYISQNCSICKLSKVYDYLI